MKIPARVIGHEAAHAVVATAVGVRVVRMSITPASRGTDDPSCITHGCVTTTFHKGDIASFLNRLHHHKAKCDETADMIAIYLAGPIAQGSGVGGASDRGKAEAIAHAYGGDVASRSVLALGRLRAESLVKAHKKTIAKVTAALQDKTTLSGPALERMLRGVR